MASAGPSLRPEPPRRSRGGDRLRWGMTGLAAIFLVVLAAAASLRPAGGAGPSGEKPGAGEPLAVLGVAPGPATRPDAETPPQTPAAQTLPADSPATRPNGPPPR